MIQYGVMCTRRTEPNDPIKESWCRVILITTWHREMAFTNMDCQLWFPLSVLPCSDPCRAQAGLGEGGEWRRRRRKCKCGLTRLTIDKGIWDGESSVPPSGHAPPHERFSCPSTPFAGAAAAAVVVSFAYRWRALFNMKIFQRPTDSSRCVCACVWREERELETEMEMDFNCGHHLGLRSYPTVVSRKRKHRAALQRLQVVVLQDLIQRAWRESSIVSKEERKSASSLQPRHASQLPTRRTTMIFMLLFSTGEWCLWAQIFIFILHLHAMCVCVDNLQRSFSVFVQRSTKRNQTPLNHLLPFQRPEAFLLIKHWGFNINQ